VGVSVPRSLEADPVVASADHAAAAALRELPEATILVFDQELRFVLASGQAPEHAGGPSAGQEGQFVGDFFPAGLWDLIEPLCRSALEGETRSREIWTPDRHCLMIDVGPLCLHDPPAGTPGGAIVADGLTRVIPACSIELGDAVLHPSVSIGFALIDQQTVSAEQVLVEADKAMYAAKRMKATPTAST
jgi:hypothetical protein